MLTVGLALAAIGFGSLGAEALTRWYRTGDAFFLPLAALAIGAALCSAGGAWFFLTLEATQ